MQSEPTTVAPPRLGYLPWMDGMRAIAVGGVMVFHETLTQPNLGIKRFVDGGWLGVDVFFAISGFLITALLLREAADLGRIRFGAFYLRRARRLVPALATLLVVVVIGALLFQEAARRTASLKHVVVAGTYTTNWYTVITGKDIRELNHTWSLAAEEQFYLLWPALLTGLLLIGRRWRRAVPVGIAVVAAAVVLWPAVAVARGWSLQRIYYGLDTRASGLGVGALLGALATLKLLPTGAGWTLVRRVGAVLGIATIVALIHDPTYTDRIADRLNIDLAYGQTAVFALVGIGTALAIWEFLEAAPHFGHKLLSWPPLVAMGRISYGLYLWDAAIVIWVNPRGTRGWTLVAIHLVLTFAAATVSWFAVERWFRARRAPAAAPLPN